jgi:hypothetical protein
MPTATITPAINGRKKRHCSLAINERSLERKKKKKKTGRRTGKGQGNEQDRGEQIFCPCFFSKKQRHSCLTIVRHEHVKKGHSLAL